VGPIGQGICEKYQGEGASPLAANVVTFYKAKVAGIAAEELSGAGEPEVATHQSEFVSALAWAWACGAPIAPPQ